MGLIVRDRPKGWIIRSTCFHRPNVVFCEIVVGGKGKLIIVTYLPPSTLENIPYL